MSGPSQPRQPKDLQGLLKFCIEATKSEDAPDSNDPSKVLEEMDEERRKWLEEALNTLSVDFVQQLANGIKVLNDSSADLDDKEDVLDKLEDWLGNIDLAVNFYKIGGYSSLKSCLLCPHPSLRSGASHLIAEISQNNPFCQEKFVTEGFLPLLVQQLDEDEEEHCQVKALYALSCIVRDLAAGLEQFGAAGGWQVVVRAVTRDSTKLRTKGCFLISSAARVSSSVVKECVEMGLVVQLVHLLHQPPAPHHEQVLAALLSLLRGSALARQEGSSPGLGLVTLMQQRLELWGEREEWAECVTHCQAGLALLQPEFKPGEQWEQLLPGQQVPPGCHVRLDLNTGERFARQPEEEADR